jgi:hypothetical protein
MQQVLGCSVSLGIAIGPQQGHKVFTLQAIPSWEDDDCFAQVAKESGFSLHASVVAQAWERQKLERLCRYISRLAVSKKWLTLTPSGNIRYDVNEITVAAYYNVQCLHSTLGYKKPMVIENGLNNMSGIC